MLNFDDAYVDLSSCGASARFLFWAMACAALYDDAGGLARSAKVLAKQFHISEKSVNVALAELAYVGAVSRLSKISGRGRPAVTYALLPQFVKSLSAGNIAFGDHAELLKQLFSGDDMVVGAQGAEPQQRDEPFEAPDVVRSNSLGRRGRLSSPNRLLFAVLLYRSDRFGVVQIGFPELSRYTGMDATQLKHRVRRLMNLGLIRQQIPGLSSSIFSSGRISSTYFLNLNSPVLKATDISVVVHLAHNWDGKDANHANVVRYDVNDHVKSLGLRSIETPLGVIRFLAGQRRAVFVVLQLMLYRYATHLLSGHWNLLATEKVPADTRLWGMIEECFRQPPSGGCDGELSRHDWDQVCGYFYKLAVEIACEFRSRFDQSNWIDFDSVNVCILPTADDLGYKAITLMLRPAPSHLDRFAVFQERRLGDVKRLPYKDEAELPVQNRFDFGLAGSPG